MFRILLPAFAILLGAILGGCSLRQSDYYSLQGKALGTFYSITLSLEPDSALLQAIDSTLASVNGLFSLYDSTSRISRFNRHGEEVVDAEFALLTQRAIQLAQASNGAFDPTVEPYIRAWGFGKKVFNPADTLLIATMTDYVGYNKLIVNGDTVRKLHPQVELSYNAIAKGYASDRVLNTLRSHGVQSALVEIGGEVAVMGTSPRGTGWRVGVDAPQQGLAPGQKVVAALEVNNGGVATSGNYRNFRVEGERTWGHTIDPRTGKPALTGMLSATVAAADCATADALATALMVLPPEESINLATNIPDIKVILLYQQPNDTTMHAWSSPGIDKPISFKDESQGR